MLARCPVEQEVVETQAFGDRGCSAPGLLHSGALRALRNLVSLLISWASLIPQSAKNLPAMQETRVRLLGQEDPLEKEMATHSSILAWRIPWTEEPGGLLSIASQRAGHDLVTKPPPHHIMPT